MRRGMLLIAAVAALATAGTAAAAHRVAPVRGVVVGAEHGVLLVATRGGAVHAVRGRAAVGARVAAASGRARVLGHASRAVVRGVLVRRSGSLSFLGVAHRVLVLRSVRRLQAASDSTPPPGSVLDVTVGIDDHGGLEEQQEHAVGQVGNLPVQAVVTAIGTGTVTLTVEGQQLTIPLPAGLTLPASVVGTQVTLNVSFGSASAATGDDDATAEQEDAGDDRGGGDSSGPPAVQPSGTSIQLGSTSSQPRHRGDGGGSEDSGGGDD